MGRWYSPDPPESLHEGGIFPCGQQDTLSEPLSFWHLSTFLWPIVRSLRLRFGFGVGIDIGNTAGFADFFRVNESWSRGLGLSSTRGRRIWIYSFLRTSPPFSEFGRWALDALLVLGVTSWRTREHEITSASSPATDLSIRPTIGSVYQQIFSR